MSTIIDIGGDRYNISTKISPESEISLGYKSYRRFEEYYGSEAIKNAELFLKVFPYPYKFSKVQETLAELNKSEKDIIDRALHKRLDGISSQIGDLGSIALANISLINTRDQIMKILSTILYQPGAKEEPKKEVMDDYPLLKKVYSSPETQLEVIMRIAWQLTHAGELPEDVQDSFEGYLATLPMKTMGSLVESIKKNAKVSERIKKIEPINYFERIQLQKIIKETNANSAVKQAKMQIVGTTPVEALRDRLKFIMEIFHTHKYINDGQLADISKQINSGIVPEKDGILTQINKSLIDNISTGLDPIFKYIQYVYDPVYINVEDFVESYESGSTNKIQFDNLLKLLYISMSIMELKEYTGSGIFKIKCSNLKENEELVSFFLQFIEHMNGVIGIKEGHGLTTEHIELLPKFTLHDTPLITRKLFTLYNYEHTFFTIEQLGGGAKPHNNIKKIIKAKENKYILAHREEYKQTKKLPQYIQAQLDAIEKPENYTKIDEFFKTNSDSIYLISKRSQKKTIKEKKDGESEESFDKLRKKIFDARFFEIDLDEISDLSKPIDQKYLQPIFQFDLKLDDIIASYYDNVNSSVLALCVFATFKKRLSRE